jgi:predicted dehydrogenase
MSLNLHLSGRRAFLKATVLAASSAALPGWFVEELRGQQAVSRPESANDKPGIALIGCGGRGMSVVALAAKLGNVVAVCDVDETRLSAAAKQYGGARAFKEFREAVAQKNVDIVVNGSPDHWHTFVNLAALKAGKDIYSEKPLTLTIEEGQRLVKEVRRSNRILQTGSQQRSDPRFRLACELVRNGRLGKLRHVTSILPAGLHGGPFAAAPVPSGLDWERWQGQAPATEYVPERCHVKFRYWLDYSGGTMTDWGAHHNDIALWGMGHDRSGPISIQGRRLVEPIAGGFTAPSQYELEYTYADGVTHACVSDPDTLWNGAPAPERKAGSSGHGVRFEGNEGWIFVTRGKIEASKPEILSEPLPSGATRLYASNDHMANFFECVRSRKQPVCDVEIGHRSVSVCHLGVIALRFPGRKLIWNPAREKFEGDADANQWVARQQRKPWTYSMI